MLIVSKQLVALILSYWLLATPGWSMNMTNSSSSSTTSSTSNTSSVPLAQEDLLVQEGPLVKVGPIVDFGYVKYKGLPNADTGVTTFYGIKYAKAPVGDLRWRAPVGLKATDFKPNANSPVNVLDNTKPGTSCISVSPYWAGGGNNPTNIQEGQGEDCLSLNIQIPSEQPKGELLPVMIHIHGGGYLQGSDGVGADYMISESNGTMIFVSINYRLGLYGFLSGNEVKENGDLNVGLLDQRLAMLWVKQNIAKFGGDPDKITITGYSAGGGSVTYQLTAYGGDIPESEQKATNGSQLFHSAYLGYPWWTPVWTSTLQEQMFQKVLSLANCKKIVCLRNLSPANLYKVARGMELDNSKTPQDGYGLFTFSPVIDGTFIKQRPHESFKNGSYAKVPLMISRATEEGAIFTPGNLQSPDQITAYNSAMADFNQKFPTAAQSSEFVDDFKKMYPVENFPTVYEFREEWFQDAFINCGTYEMADQASSQGVPVYKFIFNTFTKLHGSSDSFLFSKTRKTKMLDQEGSLNLVHYLVSFVKSNGNPNKYKREEALTWPQYYEWYDRFNVIEFQPFKQVVTQDPDHRDQCQFFRKYADIVSN